jgi:LmbE family N-acetylglucosaminyl deacetylase
VYFVQWEQPRLVVDISETMELKLEAIRCHASQIGDFKDFEARMRNRAAVLGKERGYSYAEGFDQIVVPGDGHRSRSLRDHDPAARGVLELEAFEAVC